MQNLEINGVFDYAEGDYSTIFGDIMPFASHSGGTVFFWQS
jgi:hypothetical protein